MATKRREQRRLVIARLACLAAVGVMTFSGGLVIGKSTVKPTIQPVKLTASCTVPDSKNVTYFDVPLSHSLQDYIFQISEENGVPATLVFALIEHESGFNPEVVSKTDDYGLMQINLINHKQFAEKYHADDMLNPYQNVYCGIKLLSRELERYDGDPNKALMAFNMGEGGADKAITNGVTENDYSKSIMKLMKNYEVKSNVE